MSSGGYGDIGGPESSEDRKVRATEKILSSMSYRLGKLIVDSIRKPWRLILLPISMTTLLISYGKEKMGYSKFKSMGYYAKMGVPYSRLPKRGYNHY